MMFQKDKWSKEDVQRFNALVRAPWPDRSWLAVCYVVGYLEGWVCTN